MSRGTMLAPRPSDLTLEQIIDAMARSGRVPMLILTKCDRGYQCSLQRPEKTSAFGVFIKPTASEALLAALSPDPFHSWEDHLGSHIETADDEDFIHLI